MLLHSNWTNAAMRCAFESAVAQRPDWKTLALAETVLRRRRGADHDAAERRELEEGIAALPRYTSCWARVAHALGVLLTSDRESSGALSWLIQAQSAFASLGNRAGEAQASDALGTEYAHVGRTELAAICYARSLALKLAIGDEQGIALTLGNLGRLALLLGRAEDAARLISTDLQLVKRAGLSRTSTSLQRSWHRPRRARDGRNRRIDGWQSFWPQIRRWTGASHSSSTRSWG